MAINIFSGGSTGRSKPNSASRSSRAQAARSALGTTAAGLSDSGSTAVGAKGLLGKVGNTVGKVAGIASKFLPGVGGIVAKGISNLLNDPEWWQSVPGEQITTNVPLRVVSEGTIDHLDSTAYGLRPAICEFVTTYGTGPNDVLNATDTMITQYLMPEIRKAVNAVPLQAAEAYKEALASGANLYYMWRNLKRYDYMLKHGQTYIPNLNDTHFPVLQVENAAWLQSTINRLEEYLRANVRLPHTLCCYLAWRGGRVYKTVNSAKAALVLYNHIPLDANITTWNAAIAQQMNRIVSSEAVQKANTDLYNSYFSHDMQVEIADHTQFTYDPKEWALRTNLDIRTYGENTDGIPVYLDSNLDNATAFMASTVSTYGSDGYGNLQVLIPVNACNIWTYSDRYLYTPRTTNPIVNEGWNRTAIAVSNINPEGTGSAQITDFLRDITLLKACDIYNKGYYMQCAEMPDTDAEYAVVDLTQPSMDMGTVTGTVLGNEHVFAFANLVNADRKHSQTMAEANREVASDVANMVESIDVATAAAPQVGSGAAPAK